MLALLLTISITSWMNKEVLVEVLFVGLYLFLFMNYGVRRTGEEDDVGKGGENGKS